LPIATGLIDLMVGGAYPTWLSPPGVNLCVALTLPYFYNRVYDKCHIL